MHHNHDERVLLSLTSFHPTDSAAHVLVGWPLGVGPVRRRAVGRAVLCPLEEHLQDLAQAALELLAAGLPQRHRRRGLDVTGRLGVGREAGRGPRGLRGRRGRRGGLGAARAELARRGVQREGGRLRVEGEGAALLSGLISSFRHGTSP